MQAHTYQQRVRIGEADRTLSTPAVRAPYVAPIDRTRSEDMGKLLLRLTVGGLMLFHGYWKVMHGIDWLFGLVETAGMSPYLAYGIYAGEVVAPALIILGVATRLAGVVVAFDMIMAVALVHMKDIFTINAAGGGWAIELEAFYFLGAMALVFLGAGRYSVTGGTHWWD